MKQIIKFFVIGVIGIFSMTSCVAYEPVRGEVTVGTEIDVSGVDFNVIITSGTPHYYNGRVLYYLYGGLYYYPFFYNNYWYVRAYRKPFPDARYTTYLRPHKNDYRFAPGAYRGYRGVQRPAPQWNQRPNPNYQRPTPRPSVPNGRQYPDGARPGRR